MIPAIANAPAATAIQTRSKRIHSPQGYVSERSVLPPRPSAKRATIDDAAERDQEQEHPVERGHQLLVQRLELDVVPVVGGLRVPGRRDRGHALAEERVGGAEQRADRHDGGRNGPERRGGEPRKRLLAERREPELLEGNGRQVQHARAAQLLLAVDVVDVSLGAIGDALVRDREHLVAGAVAQGVRGAGLDARRAS